VRKIKIFFNLSLNILNKVDTLESLIKEIRDGLNSQKVSKENKNDTNEKKMYELLKQEKQNGWYDEFLKLKKNYNEEYLKQNNLKMMKENIKMYI
jgi:predicted transcriptional regulator